MPLRGDAKMVISEARSNYVTEESGKSRSHLYHVLPNLLEEQRRSLSNFVVQSLSIKAKNIAHLAVYDLPEEHQKNLAAWMVPNLPAKDKRKGT
jgi:hypothetical protein